MPDPIDDDLFLQLARDLEVDLRRLLKGEIDDIHVTRNPQTGEVYLRSGSEDRFEEYEV